MGFKKRPARGGLEAKARYVVAACKREGLLWLGLRSGGSFTLAPFDRRSGSRLELQLAWPGAGTYLMVVTGDGELVFERRGRDRTRQPIDRSARARVMAIFEKGLERVLEEQFPEYLSGPSVPVASSPVAAATVELAKALDVVFATGGEIAERTTLAATDPAAYVRAFAGELRARGIRTTRRLTPAVALLDACLARDAMVVVDGADDRETIRELVARGARAELWSRVVDPSPCERGEAAPLVLASLDQSLREDGSALIVLSEPSESYTVGICRRGQIRRIRGLARRADLWVELPRLPAE